MGKGLSGAFLSECGLRQLHTSLGWRPASACHAAAAADYPSTQAGLYLPSSLQTALVLLPSHRQPGWRPPACLTGLPFSKALGGELGARWERKEEDEGIFSPASHPCLGCLGQDRLFLLSLSPGSTWPEGVSDFTRQASGAQPRLLPGSPILPQGRVELDWKGKSRPEKHRLPPFFLSLPPSSLLSCPFSLLFFISLPV